MIVNLIRNISEINLKGIFLVLAHGNVAHLKRRNNVRLLRQFAVKGVDTLKDERKAINDDSSFELVCAKYYEYSYRFCLNAQDKQELQDIFKSVLDIDIVALVERISPLGFKFSFSKEEQERNEQIEEALENDD